MFEKVNPCHPDKIADRIAGAIIDLAYSKSEKPKVAVEVLVGHSECTIIAETSEHFETEEIQAIVDRIADTKCAINYKEVPQDSHLADNQAEKIKCGDNGIFKGVLLSDEEKELSEIVRRWYSLYPTDGKFILDRKTNTLIACQSCVPKEAEVFYTNGHVLILNPLGDWTGGINVDTGATNRKLGSDMGRAVTGGGLHGKDLSKADVSVNIFCFLLAQEHEATVESFCAIGDEKVEFRIQKEDSLETIYEPYGKIVRKAQEYVAKLGGFEKLAEWGLI